MILQAVVVLWPTGCTVDWSRLAYAYDWQLPLERRALAAAARLAEFRQNDSLLDIGTGTGAMLRAVQRRPDRPPMALGIDTSRAMLARVGTLPAGWRVDHGNARELACPDRSFSVVTAAYLLHVLDDHARKETIQEVRRILTDGGRLVTVTPAWPRTRLGRAIYAPFVATGDSSGPSAALRPLDPRADLEAASFTISAVEWIGGGYPSMCVVAKH